MKIKLYQPQAIHEQGNRPNQEDAVYPLLGEATADDRLFVLCDGMGGHERGEVASNAISQGLAAYFKEHVSSDDILTDDQLREALEYAYRQLDAKDSGEFRKAGTTMTMLFFHRGGCTAAHIGDSRIYHVRPSSRTILYMSRDHSLVFELYQSGEISYDEMKTHPRKNQISRAMIPGKDNRQKADIVHVTDILPGDFFFICSDGVLESVSDEELVNMLASNTDDDYKRQRLIEMTGASDDNHSAYMVHVSEVTAEEGDTALLNDEQTVKFNAMNIHPAAAAMEEDVVRVVSASEAEASPAEPQTAAPADSSVAKPAARPAAKRNQSTLKWLPFLLGAAVVAAIIIVYAMMKNPPTKEDTLPDVKQEQPVVTTEPPVDTPAVPATTAAPAPAKQPAKTVKTSTKSSEPVNAKKVVPDKQEAGKDNGKKADGQQQDAKKTGKVSATEADGGKKAGNQQSPEQQSKGTKNTLEDLKKAEPKQEKKATQDASSGEYV